MNTNTSLNDIKAGEYAVVEGITSDNQMKRRLLDIGLVKGTKVECLGKSPMGDPTAYLIRGAVIAIRSDDSKNIIIKT